jgi:tetratricopeptide (TPR) repeat protein
VDEDVTELLLTRTVSLGAEPGDSAGASPGRAERMFALLGRVPAAHRDAAPVNALLDQLRRKPDGPIDVRMLAAGASGEFDCYLAGAIAAQQGQFALAVDCLDGALGQRPPDRPPRFWARFLHAYCCERLGQDEAAIADYGICIGLREDFAWSYHNLGLIYTKRGNYALAEENLREALRRAPDLPEAHANLGVALFLMGRFADARDALDQAIALGDQTADVLSNRAAAREALGDRQGAREDLRRALEIDPGCKAARENLQRLEGPRQPPATQPASGRSE